jgi:hypothetical protein
MLAAATGVTISADALSLVIARSQRVAHPRDSLARDDGLTGKTIPMASIHKDIPIDAPANDVWDAARDFGAPAAARNRAHDGQMDQAVLAMRKAFRTAPANA